MSPSTAHSVCSLHHASLARAKSSMARRFRGCHADQGLQLDHLHSVKPASVNARDLGPGFATSVDQGPPLTLARHRGVDGWRDVCARAGDPLETIAEVASVEERGHGEERGLLPKQRQAAPLGRCWSWIRAKGKQALERPNRHEKKTPNAVHREDKGPARTKPAGTHRQVRFLEPRPKTPPPMPAASCPGPAKKEARSAKPATGLRRSNGMRQKNRTHRAGRARGRMAGPNRGSEIPTSPSDVPWPFLESGDDDMGDQDDQDAE